MTYTDPVTDLQLPTALTAYVEARDIRPVRVIPLTGDASDRRYFRVFQPDGSRIVIALYATPFEPDALPFINVTTLFAALPVPIPRVLDADGALGVLVLEDLGDATLQAHLGDATPAGREALYARAVDHLVTIQVRGAALADSRFLPYSLAFDVDKFTWEMDFFLKHFLEHYRGVTLGTAAREALRSELVGLVAELATLPRVLCHRDYHSRNLMVHEGELWVIDFQDARLGPATYDLVSLLRDSYVYLPDTLVDAFVTAFAARIGRHDLEVFRREFDAMALQRNLKALGTFGYQATARANPVYGQYVPRTLGYIKQNIDRRTEFGRIGALLAEALPELR